MLPPKTAKEHFIHGLMDNADPRKAFGGNCVSLPVAYAAVARRLGYPVKLVSSKEHVFCRWEGTDHPNPRWRERFNFDGAGKGFSIDPDEFYLTWPRKSTPAQVELCDWLQSLTPRQELALFMANRGHVLSKINNDLPGALIAYSHCARLWPTSRSPLQEIAETFDKLWAREVASHPRTYRRLYGVRVANGRVVPSNTARVAKDKPKLPWWKTKAGRAANLAELRRIDELNRRERERMMRPPTPHPPSSYNNHRPGPVQPHHRQTPGQPPRP